MFRMQDKILYFNNINKMNFPDYNKPTILTGTSSTFATNNSSMETNKSAEERIIEKALLKINKYHYAYRQDIVNAINEAMESYHQEQLRKIKKEIERKAKNLCHGS